MARQNRQGFERQYGIAAVTLLFRIASIFRVPLTKKYLDRSRLFAETNNRQFPLQWLLRRGALLIWGTFRISVC